MLQRRLLNTLWLCAFLTACASTPPTPTQTASPVPTLTQTPGPSPTASATVEPTAGAFGSCGQVLANPTPRPGNSLFSGPGKGENDHILGPDDASTTIIVYQDFQQPASAGVAEWLSQVRKEFPKDLRVVFRHYPMMNLHNKAGLAAQAAEVAHLHGKFWEMHDLLFQTQDTWRDIEIEAFRKDLREKAAILGIDPTQFESELHSTPITQIPDRAWKNALRIQIPLAPFLLVNGQIYTGPVSYGSLRFMVSMYALSERQYKTCPPLVIDLKRDYYAVLKTTHGDVRIKLYTQKTPYNVNNFVFLAREGWYDNVIFHRVIKDYVVQTGDPSGSGTGNPGYYIKDEIFPELTFNRPGLVGMSSAGPDTNGSQFFITLAPASQLNNSYTIFGEVVSGLEVLQKLTPRDAQSLEDLVPGEFLLSVTIEEQ